MEKYTSIEFQFCLSHDEGTKYDYELYLNDEELQQVFDVLKSNPNAKFIAVPEELYKAFLSAAENYAVEDGLPAVEGSEIMLQPNMPEDLVELYEESKEPSENTEDEAVEEVPVAKESHDENKGKNIVNLSRRKDFYKFHYGVFEDESLVYENEVVIGLSDKDVALIAESLRNCQTYGETMDIPEQILNKIFKEAQKHAEFMLRLERGARYHADDCRLQAYMPMRLLRAIKAEEVPSVEWDSILEEYGAESIEELYAWADEEVVEPPVSTKKVYDGPYMKTLATMQPWASLIVCGIKDVELRDKLPAKPRKIFIAASGSKWKWEDLDDFAQSEYKKYEAKGVLPPYDKLPQKCIVGYVDIVNVTFEDGGSPWERGHQGIRYVLRNAHELDEPLYGKNKATPYFYNVEGYDEDHLPPAHICDLN